VTNTHLASESAHMTGAKNIFHKSVVFAQINFAIITGHDACSVLTAMLQHGQGIVQTDPDFSV
jgi:hypothetical protein